MNFLGMGPMELLLIIILALIVFGPAKLPEIMGQVGKAVNDFRRATSDLSEEFNKTIQAELAETKAVVDEAKAAMTDARSAVTDVHTSVNAAVTGAATLPAPAPTVNGNGATVHEEKPALADTAQWSWETATPAPVPPAAESEIAASTAPASADVVPAIEPSLEPSLETSLEPGAAAPAETDATEAPPTADKKSLPVRDDLVPPY